MTGYPRPTSESTLPTAIVPRVSVITPVFNGGRYLARTIDSVRAQTFQTWEMVIVDDGSEDDSADIADDYALADSRIRVVHQENRGGGAARNRGLLETQACSQFVAFLDADDLYHPKTLETLVAALDRHPHAVAAAGLSRFIDEEDLIILDGQAQAWGRKRRTVRGVFSVGCSANEPTSFATLAHWNTIHTPGQGLIRRTAMERIGEIDASLAVADYDMWLRLALHGDTVFIDKVLLDYRRHASAMSLDQRRTYQDELRIQRKILLSSELPLSHLRAFLVAKSFGIASLRVAWALQAVRSKHPGQAYGHLRHMVGAYVRLAALIPTLVYRRLRHPSHRQEHRRRTAGVPN